MTATYAPARPRAAARQKEEASHMQGATHAGTGLLLGVGVGVLTNLGHHTDAQTAGIVARTAAYGLVTMGLALLPDSDHHDASFAHAAGPVSWVLAHVISLLFGGHRQGMHSVFGIALFCGLAELAALHPNRGSLGITAALLAICIAAGLKATKFASHHGEAFAAGCIIAGFAVVLVRADLWWLCAMGMALHVAEDEFSGHGCAVLWPFSHKRFGGDGKQPAAARKPVTPRTTARPPAEPAAPSKPRQAKPRPAQPLDGVVLTPDAAPRREPKGRTVRLETGQGVRWETEPRCIDCASRAHGDCTDRTCPCKAGQHPKRPVPRVAAPMPENPPF
jgi:membrane-bound metal-dependent hydrolase YbcI (DUF457 family)